MPRPSPSQQHHPLEKIAAGTMTAWSTGPEPGLISTEGVRATPPPQQQTKSGSRDQPVYILVQEAQEVIGHFEHLVRLHMDAARAPRAIDAFAITEASSTSTMLTKSFQPSTKKPR